MNDRNETKRFHVYCRRLFLQVFQWCSERLVKAKFRNGALIKRRSILTECLSLVLLSSVAASLGGAGMLRADPYEVDFYSFFKRNSHCAPQPSGQSLQPQRKYPEGIRLFHIAIDPEDLSYLGPSGCLLTPHEIRKDKKVLPNSAPNLNIEIDIRKWVPSKKTLDKKNKQLVVSVKIETNDSQGVDALPVTLARKGSDPFYEKDIEIEELKIPPSHSQKEIELQIDGYSIKNSKWDALNSAMKQIFNIAKNISGISFPGSTNKILVSLLKYSRETGAAFSAIQEEFNKEKRKKLKKIVSSTAVTFILDTESNSSSSGYPFAKGYWIAIDLPTKRLEDFKECQPKISSFIENKPLLSFQEKGEKTTCKNNFSGLDYLVFEISAEKVKRSPPSSVASVEPKP